jgi:hypothetical protein
MTSKNKKKNRAIRMLTNCGAACKGADTLISSSKITELIEGICINDDTECWLNCCDSWASHENWVTKLPKGDTQKTSQPQPAKSLFLERTVQTIQHVSVGEDGVFFDTTEVGNNGINMD